ncbi:iron-containing alcohol dehydrogenase [Desulforamulus hydrothermalis]|uniref:Fe-containing alcohol dehydrogenase n=1 Tax=Desulforamulus hydrothermalis Lam5 = DSM 18033 TaxID=1121428 RepID=K8DXY8_9FIRM|nr:iron-containing alcohol dehydrogenase [Desulforamulus hydrothermalis]CCO07622.1 Fe-containing alcohol dehydrogenase [Desulforamulus hydrothermalis Lam5 = DSM 18033]SHH19694.1 Alcohol dehydrogenase, class IV [Desulforamulus hydrothermalis Lam5 = DSM 18033]
MEREVIPNQELYKLLLPEIFGGSGCRLLVGQYLRQLAVTRVLLVTDERVWQAGWGQEMHYTLQKEGFHVTVFRRLSSNPRVTEVMAGATCYSEEFCQGILAVGGGSVIDCAKGIGAVVSNGGHVLDYAGINKVLRPLPPLLAVCTLAGSAADISQFAVITDEISRHKYVLVSKALVPDAAFLDQQPLATVPMAMAAYGAADILVHAVEAAVSSLASPLTDVFAFQSLRRWSRAIENFHKYRESETVRGDLLLSSFYAGAAFSNASLGAAHALAHSLGGWLDLPHGQCVATLLSGVVEFNYAAAAARYREVAVHLGCWRPEQDEGLVLPALLQYLHDVRQRLGITTDNLGNLQVQEIALLADRAEQDPCLLTNPCWLTRSDLEVCYGRTCRSK